MEEKIIIQKAALHILDTQAGIPVFSQREMELTDEAELFIENLVRKLLDDDHVKSATFNEQSRVKSICTSFASQEMDFLTISKELAGELFEIMKENPNIFPADLLCSFISFDSSLFIGLFKLNYRSNYIHYVTYDDETCVNQLIKQKTVLPSESQRNEEAVLINLDNLEIRLVEKEIEMMDGIKTLYLSKRYLDCQDQLSPIETAKALSKAAQKISKKYFNEDFESMAKLNKAITEHVESSTRVDVDVIAQTVFSRDVAMQKEYTEEIRKAGIEEAEVEISQRVAEKKFGKKKIRTDTGVEINFPSSYFDNKDMLEFTNNPDGTISILIKKVGKIFNR